MHDMLVRYQCLLQGTPVDIFGDGNARRGTSCLHFGARLVGLLPRLKIPSTSQANPG